MADAVTRDLNRHLSEVDAKEELEQAIEHHIHERYESYYERLIIKGEHFNALKQAWEPANFLTFIEAEEFTPQQGLTHLAAKQFAVDCRDDHEIGISAWDVVKHTERKGY